MLAGSRWLLLALAAAAWWHSVHCQRIMVRYSPDQAHGVLQRAAGEGLSVLADGPRGLLVLGRGGSNQRAARPARVEKLVAKVRSWPGVLAAEEDLPRYLSRPLAAASPAGGRAAEQTGPPPPDSCRSRDVPLSSGLLPEYQPYGIAQIQATSPKLPNRTDTAGVLVCIIDSGIDAGHPDFANITLDGCKFEDEFAPAGCPFFWGRDLVGHGTHVAGTIAAQRNGVGVVGVIPGPAELYVVRIFNDSGDVNQGQGLVYGSTLILAYTQCEGRLASQQAAYPERNYRMVVSMSLGAPGPLTIERLFFREAVQRGDIVFVASSGNNATAPTLGPDGKLTTTVNPGNFPGAYPEVLAVAAVDCNNKLGVFSQKGASVDVAAPGVDVLSSASLDDRPGIMRGAFVLKEPRISVDSGIGGGASQVQFSGVGRFSGRVADCGSGNAPCPQAKDAICMVQHDPKMRAAPAPARGAAQPPPGRGPAQPAMAPSRFFCETFEYCMAQGAKAVLIANPAATTGYYGALGGKWVLDMPVRANVRCDGFNCTCWPRIANKTLPPAVGLTLSQYDKLINAVAAASKANKALEGTLESQFDAFQRLSGTSMAVPHVSGAIARVWAAYPYCRSDVVRAAFEQTAIDLGAKGKDVQFGYGLIQAEAAFDYLAKQPCAKGPAGAASGSTNQGAAAAGSSDGGARSGR